MLMNTCRWCGLMHGEAKCYLVKAIEYYQDGTVKRVEFLTGADYMPPPIPMSTAGTGR